MQDQISHNALNSLEATRIITHEMMEAGHLYAEICHACPAGGPRCARANPFHQRDGKINQKNTEHLWNELHGILKNSPLRKVIESLTIDNDLHVLSWVLNNPSTHPFLRDTFSNLAFCLKSHGYLE